MTTEQQELCKVDISSLFDLNTAIFKKDYKQIVELYWESSNGPDYIGNKFDITDCPEKYFATSKYLRDLLFSIVQTNLKREQPLPLLEMTFCFKKYSYGPVLIIVDNKNNLRYEFCYDNKVLRTSEKKLTSTYKVWRVIRDNDGSESCELVMQRNGGWKNIKKTFFEDMEARFFKN